MRLVEEPAEMRLHGGPLSRNNAVDASVAHGAVWRDLVIAENTVELRSQPLNGMPALMIEKVRAELDGDAIQ